MDLSQPFRAITPTLDGPVLRVLSGTTGAMTRAQIASLIPDASDAGVRKVLIRLAEQGIVAEELVGGRYTYRGNRDHLVWPAVSAIVSVAERLDRRIKEHVDAWPIQAISVELFGSVATGESHTGSDVDVLIVRPPLDGSDAEESWDDQVDSLRDAIERWSGNPCEILVVDSPELRRMGSRSEPVLQGARVPITGIHIRTLLEGEA